MVFSSTIFLTVFLPTVLIVYALLRERLRNSWLVLTSVFFYAWGEPRAVICMLAMILGNFVFALIIKHRQGLKKKLLLVIGILLNLGTLFVYKYLDFAIVNLNSILGSSINIPGIALPIGISFYCFQCLSYLIDVYRSDVEPSKRIDLFALYIAFFPALIAGPIVRYIDVYTDLQNRKLILANWSQGLMRFVIGLTKKVLIADPLGYMADKVMSIGANEIHPVWAWIGIICYSLQIFYDFSSYSDMAIGLGKVFNLNIPENFKFPYAANSMREFWHRWHISLSSWLKDYVYIPLGGSRKGILRSYLNLWIVFVLCGLWHGAGWPFIVWGAWHGLGLTIERLGFCKLLDKMPYVLRNLWVWLFFIIGWVFFRAPDLAYAKDYLKAMFIGNDANFWLHANAYLAISIMLIESLIVGFIFSYELPNKLIAKLKHSNTGVILCLCLFVIAWAFATTSTFSPFIYFRF